MISKAGAKGERGLLMKKQSVSAHMHIHGRLMAWLLFPLSHQKLFHTITLPI